MEISVQTIVNTAIDLADMKYSQFINTSGTAGTELVNYVNMAYKDLYQQIIGAKELYYVTTEDITVVPNQQDYDLPDDFYKLNGVDAILSGSSNGLNRYTLKPAMFAQRNQYNNACLLPASPVGQIYRYLIFGSKIRFLPMPAGSVTIRIYYTPEPGVLTFADTINVPIGGDEYMSLYCARMMLAKEETDTTPFDNKMALIIDQVKGSFKDRDDGSPSYVIDESSINAGSVYPGGGLWGGGY